MMIIWAVLLQTPQAAHPSVSQTGGAKPTCRRATTIHTKHLAQVILVGKQTYSCRRATTQKVLFSYASSSALYVHGSALVGHTLGHWVRVLDLRSFEACELVLAVYDLIVKGNSDMLGPSVD